MIVEKNDGLGSVTVVDLLLRWLVVMSFPGMDLV